jgi:hypothetical protein
LAYLLLLSPAHSPQEAYLRNLLVLLSFFIFTDAQAFLFDNQEIDIDHTRGPYAWKIKKDHWDMSDELGYGRFVTTLGEAVAAGKCRNVTDCMNSTANIYRSSDPKDLIFKADCADWTYLLRAYYAWKNNLPFAVTTMIPHPSNPENMTDLRYTPFGNIVSERVDLVSTFWGYPDARQLFTEIIPSLISTANIRTHQDNVVENLWSDFYPISINSKSLRPGTTIYDPFGHVVVVYRISEDGHIYYVDAHTDNNLTVGVFNEKFVRTHPLIGGGFKNWRPIKLVDYSRDSSGILNGGKLVALSNSQISDFSEVQYFGSRQRSNRNWKLAQFAVEDKNVTFYEYVQAQMSSGGLHINPLNELKDRLGEICQTMQARSRSVESARVNKIYLAEHPEKLPFNIYVASGEWETYSSPSRDTVLRILYSTLLARTKTWIEMWKNQSSHLVYNGQNLVDDLKSNYIAISNQCVITYYNSRGSKKKLTLEDARLRLPQMSFDAYHCPELRWGATQETSEGSTCSTNANKNHWYKQEQYIRNQLERRFDIRMDYDADELSRLPPGVGSRNVPETDILKYLNSLNEPLGEHL